MENREESSVSVFAPGSIGNVGPGFDVLGLAVEGIGDRVTLTVGEGSGWTVEVTGRDAFHLPADPHKNTAAIAARSLFATAGHRGGAHVAVEKGLPLAGGMGGSAASSVAGAAAASLSLFGEIRTDAVIAAALEGETAVAGRHLDNILPSLLGGLTIARCVEPLDYARVPLARGWWVAMVTPAVRVETKAARALLPDMLSRAEWIQQMANTSAMVHAFASGDAAMLRRAVDDRFAEPRRKSLIPHFDAVKRAALDAGSIGCSISGSGPTVFALAEDEAAAGRIAAAMKSAFGEVSSSAHVGPIATEGARRT
jgi:homoserine kinase